MISIRLILYGIAVAAILGAGLYIRHMHKEAARVPALVSTINAQRAQIERERIQNAKALEFGNDIQKKLDASRVLNDRLASRLRRALSAELSAPPAGPAEPSGTGGNGELPSVVDSVNRVIASCQRDAIRLNGWIEWYEQVPDSLK